MSGEATLLSPDDDGDRNVATPSFREALRFWLKLGFIGFGGPAGQIAIMHAELVERRRWISQPRFLHALNFCMLLPGPEAQQLATYSGWLLHGIRGGLVAGGFFVLPSVFILWLLSFIYVVYGSVPWIAALFYGLKPAVMAIVAAALIRIGRKTLTTSTTWAIAIAALLAIGYFKIPFPLVVLTAGLLGFVLGRRVLEEKEATAEDESLRNSPAPRGWRRTVLIAAVGLVLWWLPVLGVGLWQGWQSALFREGIFFSKAAVVTFGGAYAVLPYVAQEAVEHHAWLETGQMMDGLGLAETTPGPLIMVLQFVGFVGAWNQPGELPPPLAATLGALLTTWVTFTPSFLWIFLGAPHVERLRNNARLAAALFAVTAAVVGVIANLAIWFGWHVILPAPRAIDWFAVVVGALAFIALLRWKASVVFVILAAGLAGLIFHAFV